MKWSSAPFGPCRARSASWAAPRSRGRPRRWRTSTRRAASSRCAGATLRLAIYDAGGSAEEAATAVERLLDDEPEVSAIAGSWLSSFSLAATEVSERAGIPFVTESFADSVTDREGFSHVFGYSPPASAIKGLILDAIQPGLDQAGITMETVAVVGSTSAAAVPLQEALLAEFSERGIEVAVTDTWAPGGLDDPSGVATKIANADVDVIFNIAFAFSDVSGLQNELIARGVTAPVVQNGGQGLLPAWADLGPEVAGLSTFVYANPLAGTDAFDELAAAIDQPYARQDHIGGYFVVHLIAAALEQSGDPSPAAVTRAFNTVKLTEGRRGGPHADLGDQLQLDRPRRPALRRAGAVAGGGRAPDPVHRLSGGVRSVPARLELTRVHLPAVLDTFSQEPAPSPTDWGRGWLT